MRYAIVVDGIVTNVVLWDGEATWQTDGESVPLPDGSPVGIGWSWDGSEWVAPVVEEII